VNVAGGSGGGSGDPLTLMMLALPLYVLFELAILATRFTLRK
jgi:Sec-independent protein secretion pathway component TatC